MSAGSRDFGSAMSAKTSCPPRLPGPAATAAEGLAPGPPVDDGAQLAMTRPPASRSVSTRNVLRVAMLPLLAHLPQRRQNVGVRPLDHLQPRHRVVRPEAQLEIA